MSASTGAGQIPASGDPIIRVVIADDQQLIRGGFRALLDTAPGIRVVGEAATGTAAVDVVRRERPDVVLMDIRMPDEDGIAATRRIVADPQLSRVRIVVVTTFELDEYVTDAILAGASGFLVKDAEPTELIRAVRVVAAGEALLSPGITRRLLDRVAQGSRPASASVFDELTEREREVLVLVARGRSNTEIAADLVVAEATVKTHVSRLLHKTGSRDRVHLVVLAYETGIARPGWR